LNHVLDLTLPQFVSWCGLASWRGWVGSSAEKEVERDKKESGIDPVVRRRV